MEGLRDLTSMFYQLLRSLITETPETFVAVVVVLIGYYYLRGKVVTKYVKEEPGEPSDMRRHASSLLHLVEFLVVLTAMTYTVSLFGLPLPPYLKNPDGMNYQSFREGVEKAEAVVDSLDQLPGEKQERLVFLAQETFRIVGNAVQTEEEKFLYDKWTDGDMANLTNYEIKAWNALYSRAESQCGKRDLAYLNEFKSLMASLMKE